MIPLPPPIDLLGIPVTPLTVPELHAYMADVIDRGQRALVLNVNVNCMNLAYENPWLREFLAESEVVFCDGAGVMLGARLLGAEIPERITYADWIWQLGAFSAARGDTFYFLGGRAGVAEKAAARLREAHPTLRIAGCHHGYFDKTRGGAENTAVIAEINRQQPNILVMGFGMPAQERWLQENWPDLNANIALTGGAVFDYLSGELRRAPTWMTANGLEWLGRLLIEPRRLYKRYLVGNPLFLARILRQRQSGHF